jgi:hypothetical protein
VTVTQSPPTDRPFALTVDSVVGRTVTLRWLWAGAPPDRYVVEGGVAPGETLAEVDTGSQAPVFSVTAPPGAFYVRVRGVRAGVRLPASDEVRVFVQAPLVPSAPGLLAGMVNGAALDLTWVNTADGGPPTGLLLDVSGTVAGQLELPLSERVSFPAVPAGAYTVRLRATNAHGASDPSDPVTVTIPGTCQPPGVPQGFQASVSGQTVYLLWDAPASGAAVFDYLVTVSSPFFLEVPLAARGISRTVDPGRYTVAVAARNACGTGPATATQTIVVP